MSKYKPHRRERELIRDNKMLSEKIHALEAQLDAGHVTELNMSAQLKRRDNIVSRVSERCDLMKSKLAKAYAYSVAVTIALVVSLAAHAFI